MMNFFYKNMKNKKGFTLIELIVVIAILGILAAVAVPSYRGFQDSAKQKTNIANLSTIQNAVDVYRADTGNLPTAKTDIEAAKYLGKTAPVPIAVTGAAAIGGAASGDTFQMTIATGVVSIGHVDDATILNLSDETP